MPAALTRAVSPNLDRCELTFHARQKIDIDLAIAQHHEYERALARLGLQLISLPAQPDMPDSMFVEDPVVVVDELAVITRMGAASRSGEGESLAAVLTSFLNNTATTE